MSSFSSIRVQNITKQLLMCICILFVLIDVVNAQSNSDGSTSIYLYLLIMIPFVIGLFIQLYRQGHITLPCCSKENEQTYQTPIQSSIEPPTRTTTEIPRSFTPVNPIPSAAAAERTNISAESFLSQRMRDRQNRTREEVYSIPFELDERTTGWMMTTYPSEHLEGESPENITHNNPLYDNTTEDVFVFVAVQTREVPISNIPRNDHREQPPPSYSSLY